MSRPVDPLRFRYADITGHTFEMEGGVTATVLGPSEAPNYVKIQRSDGVESCVLAGLVRAHKLTERSK